MSKNGRKGAGKKGFRREAGRTPATHLKLATYVGEPDTSCRGCREATCAVCGGCVHWVCDRWASHENC